MRQLRDFVLTIPTKLEPSQMIGNPSACQLYVRKVTRKKNQANYHPVSLTSILQSNGAHIAFQYLKTPGQT